MKKIGVKILGLAIISSTLFLGSCKKKKEDTSCNLTVICVPLSGETVDCNTLEVELHSTAIYNDIQYSAVASGTPQNSTASFSDIELGTTLYLVAHKDLDNDGTFSTGDIFGFHTAPFTPGESRTYSITLEMYEL